MIIVDTSIWIEFFRRREPWNSSLQRLLENREVLAVECVFGELLQGAKNEREKKVIREYWRHLPKIDETGLWLEAGAYAGTRGWQAKGVGLIDAFIVMSAFRTGSKIWTLDKKLESVLEPQECYHDA